MKILFMCKANSCGNVLSEGLFNHVAPPVITNWLHARGTRTRDAVFSHGQFLNAVARQQERRPEVLDGQTKPGPAHTVLRACRATPTACDNTERGCNEQEYAARDEGSLITHAVVQHPACSCTSSDSQLNHCNH